MLGHLQVPQVHQPTEVVPPPRRRRAAEVGVQRGAGVLVDAVKCSVNVGKVDEVAQRAALQGALAARPLQDTLAAACVAGGGIEFAMAKATEGTDYVDPTFSKNFQGMLWAGIIRGA